MYKTEFPNFALDVPIPAGFIDNSWHNDAMPNWIRELPDGRWVVLWIDFADPAKREILPPSGRFILHVTDNTLTDVHESFITADYDEVLMRLTNYFPWIHCTDDQLREMIAEVWQRIPDDDHARNFSEWDSVSDMDNEMQARSANSEVY